MVEIKEVLRRWLRGEGERGASRAAGVDRKTARRYITAGLGAGLVRNGDEAQLTDELIGIVCEVVRPTRPDGHGDAWRRLLGEEEAIKALLDKDLTMVKAHELLTRKGAVVPYRTFVRFCVERLGAGKRARLTVRVADPKPGIECQVDFGRMGLIPDGERRRVCHALIFTACYSRHCYVHLTFSQTTEDVIYGFEAAWLFFCGVFPVAIPDNMATIVTKADKLAPRFNDTFLEYSQSRGFSIDAARVATPTDKALSSHCTSWVAFGYRYGEWTRRHWGVGLCSVHLSTARSKPTSSSTGTRASHSLNKRASLPGLVLVWERVDQACVWLGLGRATWRAGAGGRAWRSRQVVLRRACGAGRRGIGRRRSSSVGGRRQGTSARRPGK